MKTGREPRQDSTNPNFCKQQIFCQHGQQAKLLRCVVQFLPEVIPEQLKLYPWTPSSDKQFFLLY